MDGRKRKPGKEAKMDGSKFVTFKKNALYCPDRDPAQFVEGARFYDWENELPWYCTPRKIHLATVKPGMRLSYGSNGDYQVAYTQELKSQLYRMRWTFRFRGFNAEHVKLMEFLVDTRELSVHPVTPSWAYQIHTGTEVTIARHFDDISIWERDITGNGWIKQEPETAE